MNMGKNQKRRCLLKKILILSVIFLCICYPLRTLAQTPQSKERIVSETDNKQQSVLEFLGEHAYVATFGGAGVAAVCFGISVSRDIRLILWYEKKKSAIKQKRRMMKKREL